MRAWAVWASRRRRIASWPRSARRRPGLDRRSSRMPVGRDAAFEGTPTIYRHESLRALYYPADRTERGANTEPRGHNSHMKAITLNEAGTPPAARDDLPAPTPGSREVLVRVQASSANPVDNSIAAGMLAQMGAEYEYPVTLGRDYAGVVEQVGADVTGYAPGDEVFGFLVHANPTARDGSWAELITVPSDASIARRPTNVDVAAAGAAPLAAITALTAIDALDLS